MKHKKPVPKDGTHFRWYWHPTSGWEVVHVGPWDHRTCTFSRAGFDEAMPHWVKYTKPWQWGPVVKRPKSGPPIPKMMSENSVVYALMQRIRSPEGGWDQTRKMKGWEHTRGMCS